YFIYLPVYLTGGSSALLPPLTNTKQKWRGIMSGILKGITNNQKSINVPFGYSVTRSVSIIAPEDEAMLIREIYRLFILYKSYHKVSKEINNSENFPSHPYKFTPIKVKSIL